MPKKSLFETGNSTELDQLLSLLKENSEDLSILLVEVRKISDRVADICELTSLKRVEEKITLLENEIRALTNHAFAPLVATSTQTTETTKSESDLIEDSQSGGSTIVLVCNNWNDFQEFAANAQTMYFSYQRASKIFEAEALKGNKVVTYTGEEPTLDLLLKLWLKGRGEISENKGSRRE
jgi:hypothetical protein